MKIKKIATIVAVLVGAGGIATAVGFVPDRVVWKVAEFDPLVARVDLLMADKYSNDYFYATRQLERIEARMARLRAAGKPATAEDRRQLTYWRKQVLGLGAKLKLNK